MYPNFELLVVEDGCQDGTAAIARQLIKLDNPIHRIDLA
jgi:glycosyltransferase involved in cell wall biosynthesis